MGAVAGESGRPELFLVTGDEFDQGLEVLRKG